MLILTCSTLNNPCPPLEQGWIESSLISSPADVGITTAEVLYVVGWGFGVVLLGFLLGYGLGLALGLIKKV